MSAAEHKIHRSSSNDTGTFSIIIPTWNNLEYLKNCVQSIRAHSSHKHQLIVFSNEGSPALLAWLEQEDLSYIHSEINIGICHALNEARKLVNTKYIVYFNDDMYALPGWDQALLSAIDNLPTKRFMVSATLIEPHDTGNPCVSIANYGNNIKSFLPEKLLNDFESLRKANWNGSSWPPNLMPVALWDEIHGMSLEYSPGMYSDPDLSMKLWNANVRLFLGVGDSLVYHFGSKSTVKLNKNTGRKIFLNKWGISAKQFYKYYLRMGTPFKGPLTVPISAPIIKATGFVKKIIG